MVDFTLKQTATRPIFKAKLMTGSGKPVDLTDATAELRLSRNGVRVVTGACVIEDEKGGIVSYEWVAGNTVANGFYQAEIEVTYPDGGVEIFPSDRHWVVMIYENL